MDIAEVMRTKNGHNPDSDKEETASITVRLTVGWRNRSATKDILIYDNLTGLKAFKAATKKLYNSLKAVPFYCNGISHSTAYITIDGIKCIDECCDGIAWLESLITGAEITDGGENCYSNHANLPAAQASQETLFTAIPDTPQRYYVNGCIEYPARIQCVSDDKAKFWTVYFRDSENLSEAFDDYESKEMAVAVASALNRSRSNNLFHS